MVRRETLVIEKTKIEGVYLLTPEIHEDERGLFYESFRRDKILEETGFDFKVEQSNVSISKKGALRGLHYKETPPGQAKFVSVSRGSVYDVAVDLREDSETYGEFFGKLLSEKNKQSVILGHGIGHAFLALQDETQVTYLCDSVYEPELEHAIDPFSLAIDWTGLAKGLDVGSLKLSQKDLNAPGLGA